MLITKPQHPIIENYSRSNGYSTRRQYRTYRATVAW